jgi:predicted PurR-regulated permease PerM
MKEKDRPGVAPENVDPSNTPMAWPGLGYWVRVALAVIGIVVALRMVLLLQGVLLVLLASLVLALGLQPAITYLEERGMGRGWALAAILVVTNGAVILGAFVIIPSAVDQADEIGATIPEVQEELREVGDLGAVIADRIDPGSFVDGDGEEVSRTLGVAATTVFNFFTVAFLTPYFAHALPRMKRWVLRLTRHEERPDLLRLLNEASDKISGYILGNLTVSMIAGLISYAAFRVMGLEFALVLALWVALTDLIPIAGAFIGSVPALAVAGREGVGLMVGVAVFFVVYQLFENYLVSPRIMARAIDLGPAAVIVAVMVGGTLAGVTGALLALPVAAMIKLAMEQYVISARLETVRENSSESAVTAPRRRGGGRPLP